MTTPSDMLVTVREDEIPFMQRTVLGIPYWLITLIIIILLIYFAYKQGYLKAVGLDQGTLGRATTYTLATPAGQSGGGFTGISEIIHALRG